MKIAKEKLENIIKQELQEALNERTPRTSTSSIYPKDQKRRQELVDQTNAIIAKMSKEAQRKYFAKARPIFRKEHVPTEEMEQLLKFAQGLVKQPSTQTANNPTNAVLQNVTQRFKRANPEAIKKIIELQTMLVKLKVAPAKLKSGKPFVDGIFGDSTMAAIKKLYR